MDQRTSKLMTLQKALHQRNNVDRLYVLRIEGVKALKIALDLRNTFKKKRKE